MAEQTKALWTPGAMKAGKSLKDGLYAIAAAVRINAKSYEQFEPMQVQQLRHAGAHPTRSP